MVGQGVVVTRVHRAPPGVVIDAILAAALLGVNFLNLGDREPEQTVPIAVDVVLLVLQTVPLLGRRRWPGTVLAVTLAAAASRVLLQLHLNVAVGGVLLAIYAVGAYGSHRTRIAAVIVAVLALAGGLVLALRSTTALHGVAFLAPGAAYTLALLVGDNLRTRRAYTAELEARAERLEAQRERQTRDAILAERRRIARELHDLVAHYLSAIAIQANAATGKAQTHPQRSDDAVRDIGRLCDQALSSMRQLLGILREPDDTGANRTPQPTAAELPQLIEENQNLGLPTTLTEYGAPRPLTPDLSLTAYRIVQEALTNVRRHAPHATAEVVLRYEPHQLAVEILNGPGRPAWPGRQQRGPGHGLIGIRERVHLVGGDLAADPLPDGGYRICAHLPLEAGRA